MLAEDLWHPVDMAQVKSVQERTCTRTSKSCSKQHRMGHGGVNRAGCWGLGESGPGRGMGLVMLVGTC